MTDRTKREAAPVSGSPESCTAVCPTCGANCGLAIKHGEWHQCLTNKCPSEWKALRSRPFDTPPPPKEMETRAFPLVRKMVVDPELIDLEGHPIEVEIVDSASTQELRSTPGAASTAAYKWLHENSTKYSYRLTYDYDDELAPMLAAYASHVNKGLREENQRLTRERDDALANADFWERELNNFRRNAAHRAEELAKEKVEAAESSLARAQEALKVATTCLGDIADMLNFNRDGMDAIDAGIVEAARLTAEHGKQVAAAELEPKEEG